MAMGGDGPWAVAVMSVLTALALVFTLLRLYTRLIVVKSYGIDDSVYVFAFICLTGYSVFITIAAHYGFGQNMWDIDNPRDISNAILNEAISQTFAVLGMAVAKWSMGLFLLRVIPVPWQRIAIWSVMCLLMGASISCIFCFWMQCTPFPYLWDRSIEGGYCDLPQLPISIILGTSCVFADLFFAVFPWIALWRLQMNRREKYIILGSMSFGIIAAAFGTKRATEIPELMSNNYLKDTVGIIVWSAAEMAVTMVCIGIPVCRPLYKSYLERWLLSEDERLPDHVGGQFPLRTFGGSTMIRPGQEDGTQSKQTSTNRTGNSTLVTKEDVDREREERKLGINGPFSIAYVVGGRPRHQDEHSDEWPLGDDFRGAAAHGETDTSDTEQGIHVVEEYEVTRSQER